MQRKKAPKKKQDCLKTQKKCNCRKNLGTDRQGKRASKSRKSTSAGFFLDLERCEMNLIKKTITDCESYNESVVEWVNVDVDRCRSVSVGTCVALRSVFWLFSLSKKTCFFSYKRQNLAPWLEAPSAN